MVLVKSQTKNNIDIVLHDFDYSGTHFYSIMAYPVAQLTDFENDCGARRGEKICIDIEFKNLEQAKKEFSLLENGTKTIFDLKKLSVIKLI